VAQVVANGIARFSLRAGDLKDGSFALRLSAERLARLSPDNAMSQGAGLQVVEFDEVMGTVKYFAGERCLNGNSN